MRKIISFCKIFKKKYITLNLVKVFVRQNYLQLQVLFYYAKKKMHRKIKKLTGKMIYNNSLFHN